MNRPFKLYLIGSLRNPEVINITVKLQEQGIDVFSDWFAASENADDSWRDYEKARGYTYLEALKRPAARNVFEFDKRHLEASDGALLIYPAGRSGHLELGWMAGKGKWTGILIDDPERWDVMLSFSDLVTDNLEEVISIIKERCDDT